METPRPILRSPRVLPQTAASTFYPGPQTLVKRPATPPPLPPQEITIPLDSSWQVNTRFGSFNVRIHDHGAETISVSIDRGRARRLEKEKGYERTGTNIVEIYQLRGAKVYYVDRIAVASGQCVLKVIPDS